MKIIGVLSTLVLLTAGAACAQSAPQGDLLVAAPTPSLNQMVASPIFSVALHDSLLASARPAPAPAPQILQGVYPELFWEAGVGFTYTRFYQLPNSSVNTYGFNASGAYFFKPWLGGEADLDGGLGLQNGVEAKRLFSGGGARIRTTAPRAVVLWIHGVVGLAHFEPKAQFGGENAFAYEVGGGADLNAHHHKLAYSIEGDLLASSFFGTYQLSPKVSVGVVYKF